MTIEQKAQWLQARMREWPGVQVEEHPERGVRFLACRGEFLHFHGCRQVDIRLSREEQDSALSTGLAEFHPRSHEGGWVIVRLEDRRVREILRLAAAAYRSRVSPPTRPGS